MARTAKEITLFDLNESEVLKLINDIQSKNIELYNLDKDWIASFKNSVWDRFLEVTMKIEKVEEKTKVCFHLTAPDPNNVDLNNSLDRALNKLCRIKTDNQILNKIIKLVKEDLSSYS
jgi:hypothetical protein